MIPRQKALLDAVERATRAGLAAVDAAGRQLYVNDAFCRMVGWPSHELVGLRPPFPYWPPEAMGPIQDAFERTLRGEAPAEGFEVRFMRRDGERVDVRLHIAALLDGEDQLGWLATVEDISQAKRVERERIDRELVEALVEHSGVGIIVADAAGEIRIFNEEARRQHGREASGEPPADWSDAFGLQRLDGTALPQEETPLYRALRGERVDDARWRVRRPDGSTRLLSGVATPIRRADGTLGGAMIVTRDITDDALEASERRFRTLAEATSEIVWRTDPEGRIHVDSPSWRAFTGQPLEAWLGNRGWEALHPDDVPRVHEAWQQAVSTRKPFVVEYRVRRHDGVHVPMSVRGAPVLDDAGEVREWIGANIDITARIAEERERERLLESERRARAEAEAASRAKDEFLAMLGHELRNPLAPIVTALELMKLRGETASAREREVIERQVVHMTRLVDDLLDVSRITRGKVELRRERVDLAATIERAIETASPIFERNRHRLEVEVPAGIALEGDAARLAQVFANVLTNAGKYTPPGGRIAVRAAAEGASARIEVSDTGIGIAPELLPRIFDLFVQGKQSIERAEGGLGLGLTIVSRLVELHGGSIEAASAGPGQGTTMTIRLPLATARTSSAGAAERPMARAPAAGAKVLVVDDNADAAAMLADAMSALGYETHVAHDGPAALDAAAARRPDTVLLDIGLPAMDGYEVARRMRELMADDPPLLIAVTGYGQARDAARAREAGFAHHLVKPVDLAQLHALLGRAGAAPGPRA